jgi:hypothetical protein
MANDCHNILHRNLARIADKLSALSGLARLVADALHARPEAYIAGHWMGNLINSLLWYVTSPATPNRTTPYRAPTWAWPSVDGQISYFYEQYQFLFKPLVTIIHVQTQASPFDAFGRVKSGELQLSGLLVPVRLLTVSKPLLGRTHNGLFRHSARSRCFCVAALKSSLDSGITNRRRQYEVLLDEDFGERDAPKLELDDFACLIVGEHQDTKTGGKRIWWLVLKRDHNVKEAGRGLVSGTSRHTQVYWGCLGGRYPGKRLYECSEGDIPCHTN